MNKKRLLETTFAFLLGTSSGILITLIIVAGINIEPITIQTIDYIISPEQGYKIIDYINGANESLYVETYIFTSKDVAKALVDAKNRGVDVKVIVEERVSYDANEDVVNYLLENNISTKWARKDIRLTHAKIIIRDKKDAIVGSHNLSYSALNKNREISVIISPVDWLLFIFEEDWESAIAPPGFEPGSTGPEPVVLDH